MNSTEAAAHIAKKLNNTKPVCWYEVFAIAWGYLGEEEAVEATAAIDKLGRRNLGLSLR